MLFADYMLQWLGKMKVRVFPNDLYQLSKSGEKQHRPYFLERHITLDGLCVSDVQGCYDILLASGVSGNTVLHHHANIYKALEDAVWLNLVGRNVVDIVERTS